MRKCVVFLIFVLMLCGCHNASQPKKTENNNSQNVSVDTKALKIKNAMKAVQPFFKPMGEPKPDEWLANFQETGQVFDEYLTENPTLPTETRKTIYIQPIGNFSPQQRKVIELTAEYMRQFFGLP